MENNFGGKGKYSVPSSHKGGLRVPPGGSSCMTCKFVTEDMKHCTSKYFIEWNGSSKLPLPAYEYCTDWYEPQKGTLSSDLPGDILGKEFDLNEEVK